MLDFIVQFGFDVLGNFLQIIIGSVLSVILYHSIKTGVENIKINLKNDLLIISATSCLGLMLPLNTFGVLPVFFCFVFAGLKIYSALPVLFSNMLFNLLIPFNDPTFILKTGISRLVLAFIIGVTAGIFLRSFKLSGNIVRISSASEMFDGNLSVKSTIRNINRNINSWAPIMIGGVLFNNIFDKFIIYNLTSEVFKNENTSFIPRLFAKFNVVHPGFLLTLCIVYALMNFTNLAAIFAALKPKGILIYIGFFAVWALLLGTTIFL